MNWSWWVYCGVKSFDSLPGILIVGGEGIIEYEGRCAFASEVEPEFAEIILVVGESFELVVVFLVVVVEPLIIHQWFFMV